jgi:hypothetical protein
VLLVPSLRHASTVLAAAAPWQPQSLGLIARARFGSRRLADRARHLHEAAGWLGRAQDATDDGGVSWGYRPRSGWAASYPETTGYIVPTWLALDGVVGAPGDGRRRAERAIAFLASVRLPDGAFPGRRVDENRTAPSVFNTAQILHGLTAWHQATGDPESAAMAAAAAGWLVRTQDDDGAWRRHAYNGVPVTYLAHGSCWLAEHADVSGDPSARAAATRHLDWVLGRFDRSSAWFDLAGFTADDHAARRAVTHTLAYTVWGVLDLGLRLGREDAVEAAAAVAMAAARLLREHGQLPGVVDAGWRPQASWSCLTGNSQLALIWDRLAEIGHPAGDRAAAGAALDAVLVTQRLDGGTPGIRGGVAGSDPPWGAYLPFTFPNWASKFTIDALLAETARTSRV